jgi:RNA polymerase sigma-70 factor (ECF subfamily)
LRVTSEEEFEALFATHHRDVLGYFARRCPIWDAWDAASDVFVVAWRRRHEMPPPHEVRAWLFGVAHHVLANQRRGERRRLRLTQRAGQDVTWAQLPDEPLLRNEEEQEVLAALSRLSLTDREVIRLTLWEELSPPEIALVLGIARDAVDKRYSRAKKRLGGELGRKPVTARHATQTEMRRGGAT